MKQVNTFALILSIGILTACNNPSETQNSNSPATGTEAMQTTPNLQQPSADSVVPVGNTPSVAPVASSQANNTSGINPAHGLPGHRCDIPVGAPLNSPPGKLPTAPNTPKQAVTPPPAQQIQVPAQPAATTTTTAAGMNPPHGEPGHRCDIAVGAPLSSEPVKK